MQNNPLVSVIMNCYDCEEFLQEAIDSVYNQTYKNWEIIFWDNGSKDSSAEIAKRCNGKLKYFKSASTVDLGSARNLALEKVEGEFIAFLDSDDAWLPEKLAKQIPLFQDLEVGLVYCDIEKFNNRGDTARVSDIFPFVSGWCFSELLTNPFLYPTSVVIRKQALMQEDVFFNEHFTYMEDFDLFTRIAYKWKLDFVNEVLAKYRVHASNLTSTIVDDIGYLELGEILENFRSKITDFDKKYESEVNKLETIIAYNKAYSFWKNKQGRESRKILQKYFFKDTICTLVYLCTYLPFFNIKKIRKKFFNRYDTVLP